ncbi:sensor histidine kinase [Nocardioides bigeumensis]|uniref:histidine kinase n=1 Tax=Nocardioides bigeumensis TaxID=433657 RepID=A0ABN2YQ17_9ACTN
MVPLRRRFASLTSRLVLTAVALVAVVCLLIAAATTLAMHRYLDNRLDEQVLSAASRLGTGGGPLGPNIGRFSGEGSLYAVIADTGEADGSIVGAGAGAGRPGLTEISLDQDELDRLAAVSTDGRPHDIRLRGHGEYRVVANDVSVRVNGVPGQGIVVVGLPAREVNATIASLLGWELVLTLVGVTAAGVVGLVVVRRQLAPLREVAATAERVAQMPLSTGEITIPERVPDHLTREDTEVGQVGSSLNTLLAHVETSLAVRHRSEQQVRQFVADASHELRTPLTTIKGYAELARRRPEDVAAVLTALDKVESESGRMTSLVEDLLLLARLDSGRPLERRPVDLTHLLLEAVSDARVVAPDHVWRLDLPDANHGALEVLGDEQRLHQLVTNLLTNARKHTPAGTTVTVSARPGLLTVHDDGPGFPAELVSVAFERFARADNSRTRLHGAGGGAGLGLALVDAIAQAHGGSVSLTSRPGDTTVSVRL